MEIVKPAWLDALCTEEFFAECEQHDYMKKNEKNRCCLDCCVSICSNCVPFHDCHRLLQVRRYVYRDVVRLEDLLMFFDCSEVQTYSLNNAKVVFINQRGESKASSSSKGRRRSGNSCACCDKSLIRPFLHCSLSCKVEFLMAHFGTLASFLGNCSTIDLGAGPSTHNPIAIEEEGVADDASPSTSSDFDDPTSFSALSMNPTQQYPTNNISGLTVPRSSPSSSQSAQRETTAGATRHRRKGIPFRSPFS